MDNTIRESSFEALNIDLENYFSNTIIPQMFIDSELKLRKFTPPAMKQFKLKASDTGKTVDELTNNIRFPGLIENIQEVMKSHKILEKEIQTTDMRWYQMNILPYVVKQTGQLNGVVITFIDITTRVHDLKELEKLIAEHELLIDTVSHDIKNPLTSILLVLPVIKAAVQPSTDAWNGLEIIERSAVRIKSMTEDLLHMRRESSIENADAELLDIKNVLEDVSLALTKQIQDAGARIHTDLRVSQLYFSRRKLRTILYNLVGNAIKYRAQDKVCEIRVAAYGEGHDLILQVQDNGIGIAREKHQAIFTKYYRVHDKLEGTGIGLYLVNELIHSVRGTITVDSEPGKGSLFTIHLKTVPGTQV